MGYISVQVSTFTVTRGWDTLTSALVVKKLLPGNQTIHCCTPFIVQAKSHSYAKHQRGYKKGMVLP